MIVDHDDWYINPAVFAWLHSIWGPHTVDGFADHSNYQLSCFNSRCWNPGSEVVDAFTVNWDAENNWWCPPVALIPKVIELAQACSASGTLIVTEWLTSPFWPVLHPVVERFADFMLDFILEIQELPLSEFLILPSLSGCTLFISKPPNTGVLALRCNFALCTL